MANKSVSDEDEMLKYLDLLQNYEVVSENELLEAIEDADVLGSEESENMEVEP